MKRVFLIGILFTLTQLSQAGDENKTATAKKTATEIGVGMLKKDYAKVIDNTYDPIIKMLGGREKAIQGIQEGMKSMEDKGFLFKDYKVGEPGKITIEGKNSFIIVPTMLEIKAPGAKIISNTYLLGISPDAGKTWKFVDGSKMENKAAREKFLPKLPANLILPPNEPPKIIKDN